MPTNAKEIKCTCMYMHNLPNLYDFVRECPLSVHTIKKIKNFRPAVHNTCESENNNVCIFK